MKKAAFFTLFLSFLLQNCGDRGVPNCCDSDAAVEKFGNATLFLPNVFTPNGDGLNDILRADGGNLKALKLTVKLLGATIFETEKGHLGEGWEGKTASGDEAADGRYDVNWEAEANDGTKKNGSLKVCLQRDGKQKNCSNCAFSNQFDGTSFNPDLVSGELICE